MASILHSDFHIGGLKPGESKTIRRKDLLDAGRPRRTAHAIPWPDFPGQERQPNSSRPGSRQESSLSSDGTSPMPGFSRRHRQQLERSPSTVACSMFSPKDLSVLRKVSPGCAGVGGGSLPPSSPRRGPTWNPSSGRGSTTTSEVQRHARATSIGLTISRPWRAIRCWRRLARTGHCRESCSIPKAIYRENSSTTADGAEAANRSWPRYGGLGFVAKK